MPKRHILIANGSINCLRRLKVSKMTGKKSDISKILKRTLNYFASNIKNLVELFSWILKTTNNRVSHAISGIKSRLGGEGGKVSDVVNEVRGKGSIWLGNFSFNWSSSAAVKLIDGQGFAELEHSATVTGNSDIVPARKGVSTSTALNDLVEETSLVDVDEECPKNVVIHGDQGRQYRDELDVRAEDREEEPHNERVDRNLLEEVRSGPVGQERLNCYKRIDSWRCTHYLLF